MKSEQDLSLVRVEINFEEFPLFLPRKGVRSGSYVYERKIEGENGTQLDQKWTVISSSESNLPGSFDMDVFISVLELLERRGGMPSSGTMEFSLYELAEVLEIRRGGKTYDELKESLERIALTSIRSENAFYVQGQKRHITDTFRLWDITFDESQNRRGERRSRHRIEFGKIFMRSFRDHYLRGLDTDLYRKLDSPVAKRLYRLIDLKRDRAGVWEANLKDLQQQLPIGPYKYPAKIREKLSKPHKELVEAGFLSLAAYPDRERVRYVVAGGFLRAREDLALAGTKEEEIAIKLLTESGLRGDVARDLVAKYGHEHCSRYANALPYQKNIRNPAGWLRKAIEEEFELADTLPMMLFEPEDGDPPPAPSSPSDVAFDRVPDPSATEAWQNLLEDLIESPNSPGNLSTWFEDFVPVALEGETLHVLAPNAVAADYVIERFGSELSELHRSRLGDLAEVLIESP